ncbi:MAG: hypothetical protein EP330_05515 [Deltaproteobacteria bacterium]|nr:MAG: hypothetical protein EP330_05515 [Deltaproteobacteria bacterium]
MSLLFLLLACAHTPAAPAEELPACAFVEGEKTGKLMDGRLDEVSGLATHGGLRWVHNDSGDVARFFALDATTGKTRATYELRGVEAYDWEDLDLYQAPDGAWQLFLGDIGDNMEVRDTVQVHRVTLPDGTESATVDATTWTLRYPDGAHNAESLMVDPRTGELWIVTKHKKGQSAFFSAQLPDGPGEVELVQRGTYVFPHESRGTELTTAGTFSPDGSQFVLRTYTHAWIWDRGDASVAEALTAKPCRMKLRTEAQGESIAWDETGLLTVSEGTGAFFWHYVPR